MQEVPVIYFSNPSLHPPVISSADNKKLVEQQLSLLESQKSPDPDSSATPSGFFEIPLTTVSETGNFDSLITINFRSTASPSPLTMLFDTGNTMLVVPYWEAITALPDWASNYTELTTGTEPWECPAKVVRGPIEITTKLGHIYTLEDCIFYACTDISPLTGTRTANFGAGRITSPQLHGMKTPLQYNANHPYAEINLASSASIFAEDGGVKVASGSFLNLYRDMPTGYQLFDIIPNLDWMSLIPKSLIIGNIKTHWPGKLSSPIAMVDTGGGPANLEDPDGHLSNQTWSPVAQVPDWTDCKNCNATQATITLEIGDENGSMSYKMDPSLLPAPAQGLTLVMCQENVYMEGHNGMNIGGISALFLSILIDYENAQIGLKVKSL
jgi:hypothetical protein